MILELDKLRGALLREYGRMGPAMGRSFKVHRAVIEAWAEAGRPIIVIWGPPGAGKSTFLADCDDPNTLVVETTGLNTAVNSLLKRIAAECPITFIRICTPKAVCIDRLKRRENHPMGGAANLIPLVEKWFSKMPHSMLPTHATIGGY